jgi:hypothetical protein
MAWFDGDGAKTRFYAGGSQTVLAFVHAAKRRGRLLGIAAIVVVVVGAVVTFGVVRYVEAQAARSVVDGYSALAICLNGGPPAAGQRPSLRLRAMQLAALTQSDVVREPSRGEPWPDRCARHAHELREGVERASIAAPNAADLAAAAADLAARLERKEAYWEDLSAAVDATFDHAARAQLVAEARTNVAAPPEPAAVLSLDALASVTPATAAAVDLDALQIERATGTSVRFSTGERLCEIGRDGARCRELKTKDARLFATADDGAAPLLLGSASVVRADGTELQPGTAAGGWVAADGLAGLLVTGDRVELVRHDGDRAQRATVSPPARSQIRAADMLWQHVVVVAASDDATTLSAARLQPTGAPLGSLETIAALPRSREDAQVRGCRGRGGNVVAAVTLGAATHLAFWLGDRWSKAVQAPVGSARLGCTDASATLTAFTAGVTDSGLDGIVAQHRCTPAGCEAHTVTMADLLAGEIGLQPKITPQLASIRDELVVLWHAGQRGGVRLRVAPAAEIAAARDTIAFDDLVKDGAVQPTGTLLGTRLLAAEDFAVLLLATEKGLHALRIDPDAKVTPISF